MLFLYNQTKTVKKLSKYGAKDKVGFSLVTVTMFGLLATMWIAGMATATLSSYKNASQSKYYVTARSAAEAGLDYTIDQLNRAITSRSSSDYDDTEFGAPWTTTSISPEIIGISGATVTVTVKNVAPPSQAFHYDPLLDTYNLNSSVYGRPNVWRVIESVAVYNGVTRRLRAVLRPEYAYLPASPENKYFPSSLFASSSIQLDRGTTTDGYNSSTGESLPLGGTVISNTSVALTGTSTQPVSIGGNLQVNSLPMGSTTQVVATTADPSHNIVRNYMSTNGIVSGMPDNPTFITTAPYPAPAASTDNVLGADPTRTAGTNPLSISLSNPQSQVPPPSPTPFAAVEAGAIYLSGNATLVVKEGAPTLNTSLGNVTSGTIQIPPDNYAVTSLTITGNAHIVIDSGVTTPLRLFVDGSSGLSTPVSISGNGGITNSTPANVQIWYGGVKNVSLNGKSNFSGIVYAPNGDLSLGSPSSAEIPNYFGAFSARTIYTTNASVHFDQALNNASGPGSYARDLENIYTSDEGMTGEGFVPRNLQIASVQEF